VIGNDDALGGRKELKYYSKASTASFYVIDFAKLVSLKEWFFVDKWRKAVYPKIRS
jgi:hypothetical protein